MLNAARARIEKEKLTALVEARLGDAVALDLPDESVDFVAVVQVYSYVQEVTSAIQEAARVLRKGGRLAVLETDWDMCVYESKDPALTRRMLDGRLRFVHSCLPSQLHRVFAESGLALARCEAFPIIETRYDADSFGVNLVSIGKPPCSMASVPRQTWATDIRSRSKIGDIFLCDPIHLHCNEMKCADPRSQGFRDELER
jgi:SAM-dependent methyltransferase